MERTLSIKLSPEELNDLLVSSCKQAFMELRPFLQLEANNPSKEVRVVYSSRQVCQILGITAPTLIKLRRQGKIHGKQNGGKYFYTEASIDNFLKAKGR